LGLVVTVTPNAALDHTLYVGADAVLTHPAGARLWLSYGSYEIDAAGSGPYDRRLHGWIAELVLEGRLASPELAPFYVAVRANGLGTYDDDRGYLLDVRYGNDFPEQVKSVLRTALVTGDASADRVGALFSMHSRTLNRRLNAFGTGFRELVDEGRFAIARQMLEDSAMEVSQIAALLDYADASAFARAFRRWSGTTPTRWRATRDGATSR